MRPINSEVGSYKLKYAGILLEGLQMPFESPKAITYFLR